MTTLSIPRLHVVKQGIIVDGNKDIATKILINTFGVCAELEREPMSQRVKMGIPLSHQKMMLSRLFSNGPHRRCRGDLLN